MTSSIRQAAAVAGAAMLAVHAARAEFEVAVTVSAGSGELMAHRDLASFAANQQLAGFMARRSIRAMAVFMHNSAPRPGDPSDDNWTTTTSSGLHPSGDYTAIRRATDQLRSPSAQLRKMHTPSSDHGFLVRAHPMYVDLVVSASRETDLVVAAS